jgi:iron complex outermembrane receptor protein
MVNSQKSKIAVAVAIAVSSMLTVLTASAQEQTAKSEDKKEDVFEVIQVTANRTSSAADETPVALSAVSDEGLRRAGVTNPTALADVVPNLSIDRVDGLQITIRGVTSSDNTEKGDPSAAFLLNGVYIARPQAQEVSFFDIDRVEVLRGPQGTLYGRNTTAGVVNIIAAKPRDDFEANFNTAYGNFGNMQTNAMVNLPVNDKIAVRAAINIDQRDSFIEDVSGSGYDLDKFKNDKSARFSTLFHLTEDADWLVMLDYTSMTGKPQNTVLSSNFYQYPFVAAEEGKRGVDPIFLERSSDQRRQLTYKLAQQPSMDNSTWGLHSELDWHLNDELTLSYLASYREFDRDEITTTLIGRTADDSILAARSTWQAKYEQTSHELRLAYDIGNFQWQGGAYYFKEESGLALVLTGFVNPTPNQPGYIFGFPQDPTIAKSLAFFTQGTYHLSDELRATVGLRQTEDRKSRFGATIIHKNLDEPVAFMENGLDSLNLADRTYKKLTWKAGLDYDLADDVLLYGSVSTGYKAGGFNDGCTAEQQSCLSPRPESAIYYEPETLTAYEVGVKSRPLERVMLNANLFHYDYKDLQLSQVGSLCGGPCTITTNAAAALIDGLELESIYRPTDAHKWTGSLTLLDARYDDYLVKDGVNFAGEQLARSPDWVFTAGYQYTHELADGAAVEFAVSSKFSEKYYIYSNQLFAQFMQPSYHKTDVTLTYNSADASWYAQLYGKNLEDEITVSGSALAPGYPGASDGNLNFADPRLVGVRFGMSF